MKSLVSSVVTSLDLPKESLKDGKRKKDENSYVKKVIKYIPAEITAFYIAITALLKSFQESIPLETWLWGVAGALCFLSPFWILLALSEGKKENLSKPSTIFRAIVAPFAFASWVFALGGPYENPPVNIYLYGTIAAASITLIVPGIEEFMILLKKR